MSRFAIIIGVDHYENPAWRLTAAVEDALAFREWALGPGGVPPENVHLLLSPTPGREPNVPYAPADSDHITDLIHEFQRGRGADGERLYFYYAGHGAAAPGARDEASILPADVRAFPRDGRRIIGFSEILPPLQECGPKTQFFFVDACRDLLLEDFTRGAAPVVGRWKGPPATEAPRRRAQYLLYATSPGGRALETGQGVFGRLLLQGLKGHPGALVWSQREVRYELRFSQLTEFVRTEVEAQAKRLSGPWRQFLQLPEQDVPPGSHGPRDFVLETFAPEQVSDVPLRVRVHPGPVRQTCGVAVLIYAPGGREVALQTVKPQSPAPLPFPVELQLPPGDYTVLAQAEEFGQARQPCALYRPQTVELTLKPTMGVLEPFESLGTPPSAPQGELPKTLTVCSDDPHALIVLRDPDHTEHTGHGDVTLSNPPAGIYRARFVLPEGPSPEQTFEVRPGGSGTFFLIAPRPPIGSQQWHELGLLDARMTRQGYYISEDRELGAMAQPRLASLLGFRALAEMEEDPADCGLWMRLGVSGKQPMPGMDAPTFLAQSRIVLRHAKTGQAVHEGSFRELGRLQWAATWEQAISPGPWILELSLPHLAPTRYALTALRNHLNLLVVVAHDSGEVEVQQYLAHSQRRFLLAPPITVSRVHLEPSSALEGPWPGESSWSRPSMRPSHPRDLRYLELSQRYLASGAAVPLHYLETVLDGRCREPLFGCMAGYSLLREGSQPFQRYAPPLIEDMLRAFDELPDVHVLAGLCEPEHQQAHFQRALERGLPVFSDGLRILQRHTDGAGNPWFAEASQGLLPGSLWTSWIVR